MSSRKIGRSHSFGLFDKSIAQARNSQKLKAVGQIEVQEQVAGSIDFDRMVLEEQGSYFDRACIAEGDITAESVTKQVGPVAWLDTDLLQDMIAARPECKETRSHTMNLDNIGSLDTCGQLLISHLVLSNSKPCQNFASLSGYLKSYWS